MDKHSLPMMFYLNDGDTDKTGYQKLKQRAFAKALNYHQTNFNVTIGPKADQKKKNGGSYVDAYNKDGHNSYCQANSPSVSVARSRKSSEAMINYFTSESPEKKEEKLIRKRILASLENMCLLESQEKVFNMRREWMKREAVTYSRMQDELNNETRIWEESRLKELSAADSSDFDLSISETEPINFTNIADEEKEQRMNDQQYSLSSLEEMNRRKECLVEISLQHSKLHHISSEVTKCLKFDDAKFRNSITSELDFLKKLTPEFSQLIDNCEHGTLSTEDLNKARTIVSNAQQIYDSIRTKAEKIKAEIEEEKKKEEEKKREEEKKKFLEENAGIQGEELEATTMDEDVQIEENNPPSNTDQSEVKPDPLEDAETSRIQSVMAHYKKYLKTLNEVTSSLKDFMGDDSLKKFRSECQKAVNVPVNAISAVSAAHLNDKLKKLHTLLSGHQVLINSKPFNPSQHPLGVTYCRYLLAEKIVSQGQDVVSVKPDAAFPIALVVLALWGDFPQFGDLLIAVFHRVCPYLIPIYWVKEEGMTDDEYYRKLGFKYSGGEREDINMFLKREGGVVRLYFSIIISHMKDKSKPHPLDLNEAWRWLAMFTSLEPSAEITATLLFDMLDVTGHALKRTYEKQFFKLIHLICVQYLPKIEKATPAGKGGPVSRLKSFLEQLIRSQSVKPPKGLLPVNFW